MQNAVLTVHLILAALLIAIVLLQRSEGGGLGIGGGGGGGVMTGRQAANALTRATWLLAAAFLVTSIALTILAARGAGTGSVLDRLGGGLGLPAEAPATSLPQLPAYQPPPAPGQPILPPAVTSPAPAADAAAGSTPPASAPAPAPEAATPAPAAAGAEAAPEPADATVTTVPVGDAAPAPEAGAHVFTVPLTEPADPAAPAN